MSEPAVVVEAGFIDRSVVGSARSIVFELPVVFEAIIIPDNSIMKNKKYIDNLKAAMYF